MLKPLTTSKINAALERLGSDHRAEDFSDICFSNICFSDSNVLGYRENDSLSGTVLWTPREDERGIIRNRQDLLDAISQIYGDISRVRSIEIYPTAFRVSLSTGLVDSWDDELFEAHVGMVVNDTTEMRDS